MNAPDASGPQQDTPITKPPDGADSPVIDDVEPEADSLPEVIPGGHVDQMLRQMRAHHVQLSVMADQKASILLMISAIIVPLSASHLTDPDSALRFASLTMIVFAMLAVAIAAYTVMPKLRDMRGTVDLDDPNVNPMFFGDFLRMPYDEYARQLLTRMSDASKVYEMQIREVYLMGRYLTHQKYHYIMVAYVLFIAGVFVSGAVWVCFTLFASSEGAPPPPPAP